MATYKFTFRTVSKETFSFIERDLPDDIMKIIDVVEEHDILSFGDKNRRRLLNLGTMVCMDVERMDE